jgi:site-specific recombinase XerD
MERAELAALFAACDPATNAGARDAALLALLLRRWAAQGRGDRPQLAQVDLSTGYLRVLGKGNKERVTCAAPGAVRALRAWLARRGEDPGPILLRVHRTDRIRQHGLSDRAAALVLDRVARRAGVKPLTRHDLRRTMISDAWDAKIDGATIQRMVGHESQATTAKYDRRAIRAVVAAAEKLVVPFEGWRDASRAGRRPWSCRSRCSGRRASRSRWTWIACASAPRADARTTERCARSRA